VDGGPSVLVSAAEGQGPYGGVARVQAGSTCSGALLKTAVFPGEVPAYVLTAGHCARAFGADEVLLDQPLSGTVTFRYFHDASDRPTFEVRRLWFSTMKGTDLAILELAAGYGDIAERGIQGLELERGGPDVNEPVVIVGAPLQGDVSPSFLRLAACRLESEVALVLERHWHWFDFWRNGCRDILPGSSGSPVILRRNGRVAAVINTTTIGSEGVTDCWTGRPCEVDGARGVSREAASYAAPTAGLALCFDGGGRLDAGLSGCPLDDGRQLALEPSWLAARNPAPSGPGGARWSVRVGGRAFPFFRHKFGAAGSINCRDTAGYGAVERVTASSRVEGALPGAEGHYALCVLGETASVPAAGGQDPRHASVVTLEIDRTPPRVAPRFDVREDEQGWTLFPAYAPPEISAYDYKLGPLTDTDCAAFRGYRPFVVSPFRVPRTGTAMRFCAIGSDLADNPAPPLGIDLQ
jgi:hypothetical protein